MFERIMRAEKITVDVKNRSKGGGTTNSLLFQKIRRENIH